MVLLMRVSAAMSASFSLLALLSPLAAGAVPPVVSSVTLAGSGGAADGLNGMAQDASGNLYVAGYLTQAGGSDIYVAKYSTALVQLATYTYDKAGFSDAAWAVVADTATGGVFVAGYVGSSGAASGNDIWLAKFNSSLVLQSSVTLDGAAGDVDEAQGLRLSGGSLYAVGHSSATGGKAFWVARFDTSLVLIASATFVQYSPYGFDIQPVSSGDIFVCGSRAPNAVTSVDAWIGKFDSNLVLVASSTINGPSSNNDEFRRLVDDGSGGVFAVGYLNTATAADRFIQHYDSNLVNVSSSLVNGPGNSNEYLSDVVATSSGTYLVAGEVSESAGSGGVNGFVAEYSAGLALLSSVTFRSAGTGGDHAYSILIGANQDLYASGWVTGSNQDAWIGRFAYPATPTSLSSSAVGLGAATLGWASGGNPAGTYYELERSTGTGFGLRKSTTSLFFVDAALTAASTYYYRVRARNAALDASVYASTIAVVTLPAPVHPAVAAVTPSTAVAGASVAAAVAGSGFTAPAVLSLQKTAVDQGSWTATGSFVQARFSGTLTRLYDGRLLLAGGMLNGSSAGLTTVDLYDPATGAWTSGPPLRQGRNQASAAILSDGRVLVSGGRGPTGTIFNSVEIYDPVLSTWTTASPMSTAREGHQLALLANGRVLAAGGYSGAISLSSAEIYDPASDSWSAAASMGEVRYGPTIAVLGNGKVLLAGGSSSATAEVYDPGANTWSAAGTMSVARQGLQAAVLPNGRVLVAGGVGPGGTAAAGDVYDPATNAWTATSPLAQARRGHAMAMVNGAPMVIGGENAATDFATTEIYDAWTNAWRAGPALTGTRTWTQATVLDDGRLLIASGRRGLAAGTNLNTAELLSAPTAQILATGVAVADAQNLSGTWDLAGAATGYWDVVVAGADGRAGRLSGGFLSVSTPATPTSLSSSAVGLGAATLGWASGGNPAGTFYELERSTGTGFGLRKSTTSLFFVDAALTAASTYYYRVRARNAALDASVYASTIAVVTLPAPVRPAAASVAPSSGAAGTSVAAAVAGSGFTAPAVLSLQRTSVDQGSWTATGSFVQARFDSTLTKLYDGRLLLAGGMLEGSSVGLTAVDLFDPATGAWTSGPPLRQGRNLAVAATLPDGRVLVAGGWGPTGAAVASVEIYDPMLSTWTSAAPMAATRVGHQLTALADGRVLAAGGWNGTSSLNSAEIYDPALDSWSTAASMGEVRVYPAIALLGSGKVLLAGGSLSATAEVYDPGANTWSAAGTMSVARQGLQAAVLPNGKVLVAGGVGPAGTAAAGDVYDPAANAWTATVPLAQARRGHAMATVNGAPMVIGGENAATDFATTEIYDAGTNAWRAGPSLTGTRTWPQASALDDGRLVVAGGRRGLTGGTNLNTAELLSAPTAQILATGVAVADPQNLSGTWDLAGAATGYWDVVVTGPDGRVGRLSGGFLAVSTPVAPSGFAGAAVSASAILWSWTDTSKDETGFRVVSGTISLSGDLAAGATSWLQSSLGGNEASGPLSVQAFNLAGTVNSSTATRTTLAAVPAGLAAAGVHLTSGTVTWSAGTNSTGTVYRLERSTGTGYGVLLSAAATSYLDANLTPAATHYYRVLAVNGESLVTAYSSSIAVVAQPLPLVPGAPGTPAGTALGVSSAAWTWALASGASSYNLFRSSDNGFHAAASTGALTLTALAPNTAYGLRAAGVNLAGSGPLSAAATVYTFAAVPAGAAAASIASTSLVASWGLNGNPASTTAQLDRSTDAVAYSTLTVAALTSYADADLLGCTTYYYRVRNLNGDGVPTAYASFSGVTANTIPSPPAGLTASANAGGTVGLAWGLSPTEGVTGYRLYWDAGTGTVSYGAPIAVLGSTETAFTTAVLTSSASYTFALRAAHRCGTVETTGALAMSGAAAALPAVRAAVKEPDSGRRIDGNRVTILGELLYGAPSDVQQVAYQYKAAADSVWLDVPAANVNHPNPDLDFPYFVHWDVTALPAGDYDLRAVAYDRAGVPDPAPPAVRVAVDPITPDIDEGTTVDGKIKKDQRVANTVTNVVDTAGSGADDPTVRVTIPAGVVTSATATVSVIANPTITTAAPSGQSLVGSAVKIDLSNGQTALNGTAEISLTYPETVRFPSRLQIYYLDEVNGRWTRDFTSTVDTASRTVTGRTPHFSTFAIMLGAAFSPNLDSVQAYPVPYKPNGSNPDEGRAFSPGDANSGIIFANLASGSEIRIYTLTGRLVSSLDSPAAAGTLRWDARNQDGRDVASGAYFAVISAPGQKSVVKKLVIIR